MFSLLLNEKEPGNLNSLPAFCSLALCKTYLAFLGFFFSILELEDVRKILFKVC